MRMCVTREIVGVMRGVVSEGEPATGMGAPGVASGEWRVPPRDFGQIEAVGAP